MKALIADDALEQPYCRRFAGLLDFVFQGAGIDMQDGEIVSIATRQAMESNDSDGRRIGLLLARKGCAAELCSNEWKNTINEGMKFKQQAKHIRSNTTILSSLYLKSSGQLGQGIAGEFVGTVQDLAVLKDTIKLLFSWRRFLEDLCDMMKVLVLKDDMSSLVRRPRPNTPLASPPPVFFSPQKDAAPSDHWRKLTIRCITAIITSPMLLIYFKEPNNHSYLNSVKVSCVVGAIKVKKQLSFPVCSYTRICIDMFWTKERSYDPHHTSSLNM